MYTPQFKVLQNDIVQISFIAIPPFFDILTFHTPFNAFLTALIRWSLRTGFMMTSLIPVAMAPSL
jgi:hypothetical protein